MVVSHHLSSALRLRRTGFGSQPEVGERARGGRARRRLHLAANGAGQVWRVATDASTCVLASGPQNPSAAVLGPRSPASNLYVVGFGGEIVELPGTAALPAA